MMERYPEWSDKYSVQILVAIGGGGWKDYFKLSEDHDTNGFLAKLTYPSNEHIYKGHGTSKREALHKASFNLIRGEGIAPKVIKEKVLDILELANGFGANIDTKEIKEQKLGDKFISTYYKEGDELFHRGEPASDKRSARKNLVYDLLSPLWENLDRKKKTLRDQPSKPTRGQNLAPRFPENSRSSSSGSTKMPSFDKVVNSGISSNSSGSLEMAQRGIRGLNLHDAGYSTGSKTVEKWIKNNPTEPKITPSEKLRHKNFPNPPSSFNQNSANLTSPIDQSSIANRNGIFRPASSAKCDMCRLDFGPLKIFPNAFKNCTHKQLKICSVCLKGYRELMRKRNSCPDVCPLCYYFTRLHHLDPEFRNQYPPNFMNVPVNTNNNGENLSPTVPTRQNDTFNPFAASGIQPPGGIVPPRGPGTEISSRLQTSVGTLPISAGASNFQYQKIFQGPKPGEKTQNNPRPTYTYDDVVKS